MRESYQPGTVRVTFGEQPEPVRWKVMFGDGRVIEWTDYKEVVGPVSYGEAISRSDIMDSLISAKKAKA